MTNLTVRPHADKPESLEVAVHSYHEADISIDEGDPNILFGQLVLRDQGQRAILKSAILTPKAIFNGTPVNPLDMIMLMQVLLAGIWSSGHGGTAVVARYIAEPQITKKARKTPSARSINDLVDKIGHAIACIDQGKNYEALDLGDYRRLQYYVNCGLQAYGWLPKSTKTALRRNNGGRKEALILLLALHEKRLASRTMSRRQLFIWAAKAWEARHRLAVDQSLDKLWLEQQAAVFEKAYERLEPLNRDAIRQLRRLIAWRLRIHHREKTKVPHLLLFRIYPERTVGRKHDVLGGSR